MTEHPPIPDEANDAAVRAWLDASHPLAADRVRSIVAAVAPILWREWTRGRAVVELPEPDTTRQLLAGARSIWVVGGWSVLRDDGGEWCVINSSRDGNGDAFGFSPESARRIAAALLAAADSPVDTTGGES